MGSTLTQNQKVMARYMLMMEQAGAAHGDLARTINSPSNQLRLLRTQLSVTAELIGKAFAPIASVVLPLLNSFVKGLNKVLSILGEFMAAFAALFGIQATGSTSGITNDSLGIDNSIVDGVSDLGDAYDGVADSAGAADTAAKKLKRTLGGMDEINVLTSNNQIVQEVLVDLVVQEVLVDLVVQEVLVEQELMLLLKLNLLLQKLIPLFKLQLRR